MKLFWLLLFFFLIPASSAWTIDNPSRVFQINNANISFPTSQTFDTFEMGADFVVLNNHNYTLIPSKQTTIYINKYNTVSESYNITISPSAGVSTLEYIQKVDLVSTTYNTNANGAFFQAVSSNSTGWIDNTLGLTGTTITLTYPELSPTQSVGFTCGAYILSIVNVLAILFIGIGGALGIGFIAAAWKHDDTSGLQKGIVIYVFMLVLSVVGIAIALQMANIARC